MCRRASDDGRSADVDEQNGHPEHGAAAAAVSGYGHPAATWALAALPAPLVLLDGSGVVREANERARRLLAGADGVDPVGRPLTGLIGAPARAELARALACAAPFTLRAVAGGGGLLLDAAEADDGGSRVVGLSACDLPDAARVDDLRLAQVALAIDQGFVVFDTRPAIVECNEASVRILGTTREDLIGRGSLTEAGFPILSDDGQLMPFDEGPVGRCLRTGETIEDAVFEVLMSSGERRWIKATVRPIRGAAGQVEHVVSYFTDVTRAREVENLLELSERRYATLVEQLPLVVYVDEANAEAANIYLSPQVEEVLGLPTEAFAQSETFWSLVHEDDRDEVRRLLAAQLETNGRFTAEYRMVLPEGRVVWVRDDSVVICDADGNAEYVQGYYLDITEQREAADELRRERERFAQLAEHIEELFYVWDMAEKRFVYMSPAYERLTGMPADEVYANPLAYLDTVHPDDVSLVTLEAFQAQGERGSVEFRFRRPDGRFGWLDSRWFPVVEDGEAVRVVGLALDVTERKRAESALEEERVRFAQLASNLRGMFTILDVATRSYVYVSPAYESLTGRPVAELVEDPDNLAHVIHPDDIPTGNRAAERVLAGEESEWEFRYRRADGSWGWAWNRRYPVLVDGAPTRVIGFTEDVTDRKVAQAELFEERLRFQQLVENIQDIFWIYDLAEHRHVFMSKRFEDVTGLPRTVLVDDPNAFLGAVVEEDRALALEMTFARDRGEGFECEFRLRRPDGTISWVWDRSFPVAIDGKVVRVTGVAEDITERKAAEQVLAAEQERFQQLARAITGAFWVYDIALGRHVYISPAWERLTGRPVEEGLADPNRILRLVHPDDLERVRAANELRDLGVSTEEEFRYRRPDGSVGWLWRRSFPVVENDRVVRLAGLTEDVTERRLQQLELELERERFLTLADNIDGVFWILDVEEERISYASPGFERIWGVRREELYRRRELFIEGVHPDDRPAATRIGIEQRAGVATVVEYRVVARDGTERWVRDRAFPIVEDGRVVRVAGIVEDVTERRRDDAERAELTRRWRELFTDAPVMYVVCALDEAGRLVVEDANNALLEVLERDRSEVIGHVAEAFYDEAADAAHWRPGGPGTEPVRNRERTLVSASGRRVDVLIDAVPVLGPGGEIVSIRGTLSDITAKKAVEQRLRADADALGRLGGLAASEDGIVVKLERVLQIAIDRFGFPFGAVVAAGGPDDTPAPVAMVAEDDVALSLAPRTLDLAREMLAAAESDIRIEPLRGRRELRVVGLPLAYGGLRGAMAFATPTEGFDAGERELLALMAQWARYELARERSQAELRESEEVHRSLSESLRRLGERVEAVREEERIRIAREVHDELGQALTALKFDLHWLHDQVGDEASTRLVQMIDMVEQTIDAVRRVCADLRPPMLDDLGLVAALEWHAANVQRATGIACRVFVSGLADRAISPHVATEAFRIIQEALTNVARHSDASTADVRVHVGADRLELLVEDDGRGIARDDTGGLGILGMRERALRVNGSLEVESGSTGGTRVVVRVPLDASV